MYRWSRPIITMDLPVDLIVTNVNFQGALSGDQKFLNLRDAHGHSLGPLSSSWAVTRSSGNHGSILFNEWKEQSQVLVRNCDDGIFWIDLIFGSKENVIRLQI